MIRRLLALMALLAAVVPAGADELLMMDMPAGSPAVRSMLLWPPDLATPSFPIDFLFDARDPCPSRIACRFSGTSGNANHPGQQRASRCPTSTGGVRRRVSPLLIRPGRWPAPPTRKA